jgi:hypothetical protein
VVDLELKQSERTTAWYGCSVREAMLMQVVVTDSVDEPTRRFILKRLLPGLRVAHRDQSSTWRLYDVGFEIPSGYQLRQRHLFSGDIGLRFEHEDGLRRLLVRQVYPAGLALSRRSLDGWLAIPPFTDRRRAWRAENESMALPAGSRFSAGLCRRGWRRYPSPMGWLKPMYTTSVGLHDRGLDRLLLVEHQARRADIGPGQALEVANAMNVHRVDEELA